MNKLLVKALVISFLFYFFTINSFANNQKRALIIAISNYKMAKNWKPLASLADLELIKKTLLKQGFPASNILTITDANATKEGIQKKVFELINLAQKGDKIVIHYSGHGQQLTDLNGDEKDTLDEAIVPYDAPSDNISKTYRGEKHIIDDEIKVWIDLIKAKIEAEGHLLLILDCCHAGTASRGNAMVRGTNPPILFSDKPSISPPKNSNQSAYFDSENPSKSTKGLGKFIMFTGAEASQQNFQTVSDDGKPIGSLTYAVTKAFDKIVKGSTYKRLFSEVSNVMQSKKLPQTPDIQGDGDEKYLVFNGEVIIQEESILGKVIEQGKKYLNISRGQCSDINVGAKFEVFQKDSQNNKSSKPVSRGRVIYSDAFESTIELEENNLLKKETELWAVQTEQAFGNYKVGLKWGEFEDKTLQKSIEEALKTKNLISFSENYIDLEIFQENDEIKLIMPETAIIFDKIEINRSVKDELVRKIIDFGKSKVISSIELNNDDFRSEIILKHANLDYAQNGFPKPIFNENSFEAYPTFSTTDKGWLTIKNTGNKPFYFTILDIQPDGQINIILPDASTGYSVEEVRLGVGQEKGFPIKSFNPPFGIEKFKVIMSDKSENFSFLGHVSRSVSIKVNENNNPLESLFKDLSDGTMSRSRSRSSGNNIATVPIMGGTSSFTFRIVE
jgi:metacaspase-1